MKKFELKKIKIGDEILAYREGGRGEKPLLLIHGNMSSSFFFLDLMNELENDFKLFAIDLRGFGKSSYYKEINSLKDFSKDLEEFIKILRLKDINILGWSTGGGIAMQLAADNPELINRIILMASVGIKGYPIYKKDAEGRPILSEHLLTKQDIREDPIQVNPVIEAIKNEDIDFYKKLWKMAIYNMGNFPDNEKFDLQMKEAMLQKNLVDVNYALTRFNISNESNDVVEGNGDVDKIKCKVDIIQGENDLVVPLYMAESIYKSLKENSKLHIIKDSGHNPMIDSFDNVIDIIRKED